jgi:hypothetical protein
VKKTFIALHAQRRGEGCPGAFLLDARFGTARRLSLSLRGLGHIIEYPFHNRVYGLCQLVLLS